MAAGDGSPMVFKISAALRLGGAFGLAMVPACGGDPVGAQWMLQVDTLRSDTDGTIKLATTLEVLGQDGVEGQARDKEARLRFECRSGTGAFAAILTTGRLAPGTAALRITLDSRPPYEARAATGTFGKWSMMYISEWSALLDSLRRHRSMLLEYSVAQGPTAVAEFSVAGVDSVRPRFLAACGQR